jgi:hypothetical protein
MEHGARSSEQLTSPYRVHNSEPARALWTRRGRLEGQSAAIALRTRTTCNIEFDSEAFRQKGRGSSPANQQYTDSSNIERKENATHDTCLRPQVP